MLEKKLYAVYLQNNQGPALSYQCIDSLHVNPNILFFRKVYSQVRYQTELSQMIPHKAIIFDAPCNLIIKASAHQKYVFVPSSENC